MFIKFIFDRLVAFIGLLLLWPIILITAILIKIKMPGGPAFFVQKRVGKGGRLFNCHKFRSMTVAHNGSSVSVAGDARITPFGAKASAKDIPTPFVALRESLMQSNIPFLSKKHWNRFVAAKPRISQPEKSI